MASADVKVTSIVSRVAFLVSATVTLALPLGYLGIAYADFSGDLAFKARVKATALNGLVATMPDVWMFAENRMQGLLAREPVPLGSEEVRVYDDRSALLSKAGGTPAAPAMSRSHPLYDATRVVGRLEVSGSLRPLLQGTAVAGALGILLGGAVFAALRSFPLRALRRVTDELFDQKQRAEVSLRSIGDAVITTDAVGRIQFLNPVAERLSGWTLGEVRGQAVAEVLRLVDAATGAPAAAPLSRALAEDRIVSFEHDIDLVRRDGSRIAVEDSAAPIHDPEGGVSGGVLVLRDVSAARSLTRQRSWDAAHDPLTGLVNRREFEAMIEASVANARGTSKQHAVCFMDLDRFKVVNDTCGHAAGDDLLKKIAATLQSHIRESDTLARLGGDEFGLLLEGCPLERAQLIATDLVAAVDDLRFGWDGKVFSVGISIGVAAVTGEASGSAEVLGTADTACYWAKEQGRNRVCVYRAGDSDMDARRREVGWIARINAALADDRLTLYHQRYLPLNASAAGRAHLEVLLRMIDETGQLVQPGSFLPAAERYNLMPAIDRWVVRTVFAGYGQLLAQAGGAPLTCAVNLSGTSLNAPGFLDFVREQAREHALPPGSICFEVTETAAINSLRDAAAFMRECRALGVLFALDDFGTGSSSFGYLKNLPVDYLKIDGGFVKNLERDQIDKAMTETMNRIGHFMGIKTVAEYAENDAIIDELRRMGVDYAQGFGVCRPAPLFTRRAAATVPPPSMTDAPAVPAAGTDGPVGRTSVAGAAST